ncbi:MAG: hypothetical protein K8F24_00700 [Bacteroidales bacterium]|nr:hypothetical protein [Bacteroidales bacterium]
MIPNIKSYLTGLTTSLVVATLFLFSSQLSHAQNLGAGTKEGAKKEAKTEKGIAAEKSEKTMHSTKKVLEEQSETAVEPGKTFEKEEKEVESAKTSEGKDKLAEIKKRREEIELRKQQGKLTEKQYQDAINKLDKMEKELKSESKPKPGSKGGC